jgi:hypothetical protein
MMPNIFEDKTPMPPKDNSPDVVRVALTRPELWEDLHGATSGTTTNSVENLKRPRFGHGY